MRKPDKPFDDGYVYTALNMIALWELWEAYHEQENKALDNFELCQCIIEAIGYFGFMDHEACKNKGIVRKSEPYRIKE